MAQYVELAEVYASEVKGGAILLAEPNAGKPKLVDGQTVYNVSAEDFAAAAESDENPASEAVKAALASLSASAREVMYLRFYDGMSYEHISAVRGISEQAINGRLRRAKRKLADYLSREGFGDVRL